MFVKSFGMKGDKAVAIPRISRYASPAAPCWVCRQSGQGEGAHHLDRIPKSKKCILASLGFALIGIDDQPSVPSASADGDYRCVSHRYARTLLHHLQC